MTGSDGAPAPKTLDALVIGAGPAGIGTALALSAVDDLMIGVIDRGQIGQTFLDWPTKQTFLTPSFTGNGFGATDLNAVHPRTSPAYSLGTDYLTGPQYAKYLRSVVQHFQVPVLPHTEVTAVEPAGDEFTVTTSRGPVSAHTVVWAGGEFSDRPEARLAGISLSDHSATGAAWEPRSGRMIVIGGYESGIDIACHHIEQGAQVTVVDAGSPWDAGPGSDPSFRLAPRSRMRLNAAAATGRLTLTGAHASSIKRDGAEWVVSLGNGTRIRADSRPIAATGFGPGLGPVSGLFTLRGDGWPELDDDDQSTITPGLFLSGPAMRHGALKFCFVYKFRQRFAHIARVIGEAQGKECGGLEEWRTAGMLTDDLSCCGVECAC
ncbi:NAD(P)-binding domain-containing protein [Agreia pratensis]|uniref:Pyridine nucleotide-disulphide oxidoreductase n=1 Tax=Agreia pratensis TaxID=150121 RepID=A0A1X7KV54_9MICO|nr:NAD(P)/FAD-dependent oxidoreductase [Agreia pratensis]MBF4635855.1 NAD(P)-binding domain-containing protein [Agreia pratensis]SMG45194.1 Pyridine nucleotide-disulphide oxidoreductase [Agreia pratensis]